MYIFDHKEEIRQDKFLKTFKLVRKLGTGGFGEIFHAINLKNNSDVAIKLEKISLKSSQLFYEAKIYQYLLSDKEVWNKGIPTVYFCKSEEQHNIMVMELLGSSLSDIFNYCKKEFSLKTILMIALQMLDRIEYIHKKELLHRDIKPENFLIGNGKKSSIVKKF